MRLLASSGCAVLGAALSLAACGSSDAAMERAAAGGASSRSVEVGGTTRDYRLYRPDGITGRAPVVLVYHGWLQTVDWAERRIGWKQAADRHGFVAAFPVGVDESFNAGGCCGPAQADRVDDVAAAHAIIDDIAGSTPIDRRRIYATGFSNGAMMVYRLACESERFAAVGPVSGTQVVDCARPRPTSVLHLHGTDDDVVPFGGAEDSSGGQLPAVRPVINRWRARMDCVPATLEMSRTVRRSAARCPGGRDVELVTIRGLDHEWPTRSSGLDATETLWRFFARHRRSR